MRILASLSIVGDFLVEGLVVLRMACFSQVVGHVTVMASAHGNTQPHVIDVTLLLAEPVRVVKLATLTLLVIHFLELLLRLSCCIVITCMHAALHLQLHQALLVEVDRLRDWTVEVGEGQTIHDFALRRH